MRTSEHDKRVLDLKHELLDIIHRASLTNDIEELKTGLLKLEHVFPEILQSREWILLRDDSEAMRVIIKQLVKVFSSLTVTFSPEEFQEYIAQIINTNRRGFPVFLGSKKWGREDVLPPLEPQDIMETDEEKGFTSFLSEIQEVPVLEEIEVADIHALLTKCMKRLETGVKISTQLNDQTKMILSLVSINIPQGKILAFDSKKRMLYIRDQSKNQETTSTVLIL